VEVVIAANSALSSIAIDATTTVRAVSDPSKPLSSRLSSYKVVVDQLGAAPALTIPDKSSQRPPRAPGKRLSMELAMGDCLNGADPFTLVKCTEAHSLQVYGVVRVGAPGDPYPANLGDSIANLCRAIPRSTLRPEVGSFPFTYWIMNESAWTGFD